MANSFINTLEQIGVTLAEGGAINETFYNETMEYISKESAVLSVQYNVILPSGKEMVLAIRRDGKVFCASQNIIDRLVRGE